MTASAAERHEVRRISIIAPMLDESAHIDHFVEDVANQDFDGEVELIVADGGSTDGSVDLLRAAVGASRLPLVVLGNTRGWVSRGLNACIERADGDLIVRLDCHSRYPPDYLRRCAVAAEETGAEVVGGVISPEGRTLVERSVACAMDGPFGGIGFYRVLGGDAGLVERLAGAFGVRRPAGNHGPTRVNADTVTFGAFRSDVFARFGLFDEYLRRNQDDEFTLRIRSGGGRVVLDPTIRVFYRPRGSFRGVFRQYFEYGLWKVAVIRKHRHRPNPRSLAPIVFVTSLSLFAAAGIFSRRARLAAAGEVAVYGFLATAAGAAAIRRRNEPWSLLPIVLAVFPTFHVGYGLGMLRGVADAALPGRTVSPADS